MRPDIDVDRLLAADAPSSIKSLCYKTVDVFAGITKRKLWLKDAADGRAKTNGYLIEVPFAHPRAYQYTEHEISHVLFESDVLAKTKFIEEYSRKIGQVATKAGAPINERTLRGVLNELINVLDDERVISLWGLLYHGSEALMRRMKLDEAKETLTFAHEDILQFCYCLASRNEVPPGKLDRYRPYLLEALRKVHLCDYFGCLVTSKWLVVQIVSEIIRESRGEPPLPCPPSPSGLGAALDLPTASTHSQDTTEVEDAEALQDDSHSPGVPRMPWESEDPSEEPPERASSEAQQAWHPPDVQATAQERAEALNQAIDRFGALPEAAKKSLDDVSESKFKRANEEHQANRRVRAALAAEVKDDTKLETVLAASSDQMLNIVRRARETIRNTPTHDDRIRNDAYVKVIFTDVAPSEHRDPHLRLSPEDEAIVQRLRAMFHRVMGRRVNALEDAGTQIDIPALIERRLAQDDRPVFCVDRLGRGFRALVLVDRSGSMEGVRTQQAERSCQIISRALKFPFVRTSVWGFQSWNAGEVNITRFRPGAEVFESDSAVVGGVTPLHTAIRVAIRDLEDGSDRKHLFVLSDGFPVFARKDGATYGTATLMGFVRSNVMLARTKGIGVTGVMIGDNVAPKSMAYMFGPSKYWRVLNEEKFGPDLIDLVTQSFTDYLRSR